MEKELAKRSHFCQKVIKKLKEKVKSLENGLPEPDSGLGHYAMRGRGTKSGLIAPASTKNRNNKLIQSFDF